MATEAHPTDSAAASGVRSIMAASLGVGVVLGSLFSSFICRRKIELGMVPVAGLGLALSLLVTGLLPPASPWVYAGLMGLGFSGGCFMNPLYAYVQDRAVSAERARMLSGVNLMDCLAGVVAMVVVWIYLWLGMRSSVQVLTLVIPTLAATAFITKLLPQQLVRFVFTGLLRSLYKVRAVHAERVPQTGGVLLLPNHISYVDALLLSVACARPVRFVIWDVLYKVGWMNGFLRIFNTVPISPTRAKDAIRTVAEALKQGEVVCLFPEGQITRTGAVNEIRKGFELMARQADVPVLPVYLDGLWGSIFSFKGGKILDQLPSRVRYPVSVFFGSPIEPRMARTDYVRECLLNLSSEAFLARKQFDHCADMRAQANMMRISHLELFLPTDTVLVLDGRDGPIAHAMDLLPGINVAHTLAEAAMALGDGGKLVAIGTAKQLEELNARPDWKRLGRLALCWQSEAPVVLPEMGVPVLRGWFHEATGTLLATELPDPPMPQGEEGAQLGIHPGSLGRLLPGLAFHQEAHGLRLSGLPPGSNETGWLEHGVRDYMGFVTLVA